MEGITEIVALAQDQKEDKVQHEEVPLQQEVTEDTETHVTGGMRQTTVGTGIGTGTTKAGTETTHKKGKRIGNVNLIQL